MDALDTLEAIATIASFALELFEFIRGRTGRHQKTPAKARKRGRAHSARPRSH